MDCPICGKKAMVTDSRNKNKWFKYKAKAEKLIGFNQQVWRRQHCNSCSVTFTTIEKITGKVDISLKKEEVEQLFCKGRKVNVAF